jgi:hypothetical protein
MVSAWIGFRTEFVKVPERIDVEAEVQVPHIEIKNGSEEPVYDVKAVMATGMKDPKPLSTVTIPIFPPVESYSGPTLRDIEPGPITLSFTDAAGLRWTRHPDGQLEGPPPRAHRSVKDRLDAFAKGQVEDLDS